ncbi:hypothetical protein ACOQFV_10095 [Nocardiopsis changdeensis]|uniref:Uncharacterized protein n=1 Tax=Nocardiopsis changdeensis TaxID=2831969 RepID=A0ABX8BUE3_9ACTN|nr:MULTISPECIES: hypothetical protein [Nocardiopsis]QUX25315.1 hypothetical protein KGD84_14290 [Nocardiopsis changdeensis]QYX35702.1 hypothetical protein K1J57_23745 [Nocardiopsis sp. MT53]
MDFPELQRRLRAAGHDAHLAYDGRRDPFLAHLPAEHRARGGYCRGAWNLYPLDGGRYAVTLRELYRPSRYPPDTTGPEPAEFDTEQEACAYLWEAVAAQSPPEGTRDLAFGELPGPVAGWIRDCGFEPGRTLFGNPFVATLPSGAVRLSRVGDAYELRRRSDFPPTVGEAVYSTPVWEDVCRVLMTLAGDARAPGPLGTPRVGFAPGVPGPERARRLAGAGYADIARAYGDGRGGPLLDVLAEGAAVDLATPEILRRAEAAGLPAYPYGDGCSITFGYLEERYRLSRTGDGHVLERARERENTYSVLAGPADLEEVRALLLRHLGG